MWRWRKRELCGPLPITTEHWFLNRNLFTSAVFFRRDIRNYIHLLFWVFRIGFLSFSFSVSYSKLNISNTDNSVLLQYCQKCLYVLVSNKSNCFFQAGWIRKSALRNCTNTNIVHYYYAIFTVMRSHKNDPSHAPLQNV
jgi:hypothetical protein